VFSTRCLLFSYVLKLLFAYSHIVKQVATVMEATVRIAAGVMLLLRAIFAKTGRIRCPMGVRYVHLNYLFPLGIRTPAFNEFTLQAGSFAVQPFSRYQQIHDTCVAIGRTGRILYYASRCRLIITLARLSKLANLQRNCVKIWRRWMCVKGPRSGDVRRHAGDLECRQGRQRLVQVPRHEPRRHVARGSRLSQRYMSVCL